MKKYILSAITVIGALAMTSCSDFLQPENEGAISSDTFFANDQQAIDAIDGCYMRFLEEDFLGRQIMWEQGAANDFVWGRTRGYPELATLSLTGSVGPLNDVWGECTKTISRSNWVVQQLLAKKAKTELTEIESRSLGEAYFCRALSHFYLAYRYGTGKQGFPFVRYEDFEAGYDYSVPTQQETVMKNYEMIIYDFEHAKALLPDNPYNGDDPNFGRAWQGACVGYMAKVYAYWACWDKTQWSNVITCVNDLESKYGRSIKGVEFGDNFTSDYAKWRNTEYIWTIPSEGGPHGVYGGVEFPGVIGDNSGWGYFNCWGQFKPSLDIYEEMKKDDASLANASKGNIRLKRSIVEYGDPIHFWGKPFNFYSTRDVESGFMIYKYMEPFEHGKGHWDVTQENGNPLINEKGQVESTWIVDEDPVTAGYVGDNGNWPVCRMNFPLLRYADCMLLRAEAYLATGNAAGALKDLNAIRERSNLTPLNGASWSALYHERRVELAFEHSDHLYDCKRWAVSGDAEIKALALAELTTHPRARHYKDRSLAGTWSADGNTFTPNTDFEVGPYLDYQEPGKTWSDYKIAFPYRDTEVINSNGKLKQNEGY